MVACCKVWAVCVLHCSFAYLVSLHKAPFSPIHVLTLTLLSLQSCEDFLEPPLEELLRQLKAVDDLVNGWLCEQLTTTLSGLISPDDLFNFFDKLRGEIRIIDGLFSPPYFLLIKYKAPK
jgi:hypothetical protein